MRLRRERCVSKYVCVVSVCGLACVRARVCVCMCVVSMCVCIVCVRVCLGSVSMCVWC